MLDPLFRSFWSAGFESATHINRYGTRLDLIAATQHDRQAEEDYARIARVGIRTARDGVRWPMVERGGTYSFASFTPMLRAARRRGVQVIWTLCHYGWPDDLDPFARAFVPRFERYCRAVARVVRDETDEAPLYTPINEPSFLAWAAGDTGGYIHPFVRERGDELKVQLVRAGIAGAAAILDVDPRARFVWVDPMINIVAPRANPARTAAAARYNDAQYQAWEMLLGRGRPDLGGDPRFVHAIGVNFYHDNQWEFFGERLRWDASPRDPRWMPLHQLLARVHSRFGLPIFIGETSHFGDGRGRWILDVADEACLAHAAGVPIEGICLYPILDRPDWENAEWWHHSGLWDIDRQEDGRLARVLNREYASALEVASERTARAGLHPEALQFDGGLQPWRDEDANAPGPIGRLRAALTRRDPVPRGRGLGRKQEA